MLRNLCKRVVVSRPGACTMSMSRGFSTTNDYLNIDVKDDIMTVAFNRPKTYNAMTVPFGEEFEQLVSNFHINYPNVKAVIFTGEGKAFSAGGDKQFLVDRSTDTSSNNMYEMSRFYNRFLSVRKLPVPTIAAINGPCVGAGACFAMACDLRVAASSANVGFVFSKLGLHPGMAATHFLPRLIGMQHATQLLLTGEIIPASKAKELGILAEIVPVESADEANDAVRARAFALAQQIAEQDSLATRLLLRTLRNSIDNELNSSLIREAESQALCYNDATYAKRVDDLVNKRNK